MGQDAYARDIHRLQISRVTGEQIILRDNSFRAGNCYPAWRPSSFTRPTRCQKCVLLPHAAPPMRPVTRSVGGKHESALAEEQNR